MQVNTKVSGMWTKTYCKQQHSLRFAWLGSCTVDCLRGLPDGEEGAEGDDAAEVQAEVAALRADSENTGPLITDEQLLAEFKLLDVNLNGYLEKDGVLCVRRAARPYDHPLRPPLMTTPYDHPL